MILKSLEKNLKHKIRFYQNLIVFSWDSISFKKRENSLKSSLIFIFIIMAHTAQNSSKEKKKTTK